MERPSRTIRWLRIAVMRSQFNRPTPKQQAYEDMFWALLNSSEFLFNH